MRPIIVTTCLALCALSTSASAQMAAAAGRALPSSSLPDGTVRVRIFDGDMSKPLPDYPVRLIAEQRDRQPLEAKTDDEGRAYFSNVPVGSRWQAQVKKGKDETLSEIFAIPKQGGIAMFLSPTPFPGQKVNIATMSMPAKQEIHVHVTRDGAPLGAGLPVNLVHYSVKDTVRGLQAVTGNDGVAIFKDMPSGALHSYVALAKIPRSDGTIDRLMTRAATLPAKHGARVELRAPAEGQAPADQIMSYHPPPASNDVLIGVYGSTAPGTLRVIRPDGTEVRSVPLGGVAPAPEDIRIKASSQPAPKMPAGEIQVSVGRARDRNSAISIPQLPLTLLKEDVVITQAATDSQGLARFSGIAPGSYRVQTLIAGKEVSVALEVTSESGVAATITAQWFELTGARLDNLPATDAPYIVQLISGSQLYWSYPFHTVEGRGTSVSVVAGIELLTSWTLDAWVEDEYLGIRGNLFITNPSPLPFQKDDRGVMIPLPTDFLGGRVADELEGLATVIPNEGILWLNAMPPGETEIRLGFTLKSHRGKLNYRHAMPFGAQEYGLITKIQPGMSLDVRNMFGFLRADQQQNIGAAGVYNPRHAKELNDNFYYISPFTTIAPGKDVRFTFSGLPMRPSYQRYTRIAVGFIALGLLLWMLVAIWRNRGSKGPERGELYDDLVELARLKASGKISDEEFQVRDKELRDLLRQSYTQQDSHEQTA